MWIESHQSLARHPKTRKAARQLDVSIPTVMGHLHLMWHWALDYAQDGDLTAFQPADIADAAMWEGDPDRFVNALKDCGIGQSAGFLEDTEDGQLVIHDWYDYAGKLIEKRKADAARKRSLRQAENVHQQSEGRPEDIHRTAQVPNRTTPNRTQPDSTVPGDSAPDEPDARLPQSTPRPMRKQDELWGAHSSEMGEPTTASVRTPNPAYQHFEAYCKASGIEPDAVPKSDKARQLKAGKEADRAGYAPAQTAACTRFMHSESWRDTPPDLPQVVRFLPRWVASGSPSEPQSKLSAGNSHFQPRKQTAFDDNVQRLAARYGSGGVQ
ncbi:MAG: hypothetical protein M3Q29_01150 [Chloroflexota bacterium]|nr:hypothetical protein [Chloroflexota bacterium]